MKFRRVTVGTKTTYSLKDYMAVVDQAFPEYGFVIYFKGEPRLGGLDEIQALSAISQFAMEEYNPITHNSNISNCVH
ncbi:hypothetical protein [Rhizobium phage RHph_X2_28B]|uniref:hypothetical protein n=1 Tax=Rhizobium phage RHph_X2_28B TaxID=2836086 RepID=UPI0023290712|nr:hypothetical protein PP751_gp024 [Rhizobium phage RHph_X2_28B]QWY83476.1 hypothetical protein [Rhizobium phage RHph_X2_28B]QWY83712.1 hypothetical protein [Rhizobium phage RHph_X3_15]